MSGGWALDGEEVIWSGFDTGAEGVRYRGGFHFAGARGGADGDDDEFAGGGEGTGGWDVWVFPDAEDEADGLGAHFCDEDLDFGFFFELEGLAVFSGDLEAGPAGFGVWEALLGWVDAEAEGSVEGVFGVFHPAEEDGEVHDAGEVGFREGDAAAAGETAGHERG